MFGTLRKNDLDLELFRNKKSGNNRGTKEGPHLHLCCAPLTFCRHFGFLVVAEHS